MELAADPSFEAFFDTIDQTPRAKAERIFEAAREVYEDGEIYKPSPTSAAKSKGPGPFRFGGNKPRESGVMFAITQPDSRRRP